MTAQKKQARAAAEVLADVPSQLAALETMKVAELAKKHEELFGEPTRSRNKAYLKKKLAWRIQANAEGGLSDRAITRIAELGDEIPERWRVRQSATERPAAESSEALPTLPVPPPQDPNRDPRLPPAGAVLTREFRGVTHQVTVGEDAFEYQGESYKSLSTVAKRITGGSWNGFLFFGLTPPKRATKNTEGVRNGSKEQTPNAERDGRNE